MGAVRLRVLCVDDNHDIADSEVDLLGLYGFEARACYGGRDAVAEGGVFCPDVYLIDLNMPGMDGCEVARELRLKHDGPPPMLVAVTARSGSEDYRRTKAAGFDDHLVKPVEPERLRELLSRLRPAH